MTKIKNLLLTEEAIQVPAAVATRNTVEAFRLRDERYRKPIEEVMQKYLEAFLHYHTTEGRETLTREIERGLLNYTFIPSHDAAHVAKAVIDELFGEQQ